MKIDITPLRGKEVGATLELAEVAEKESLGDLNVQNLAVQGDIVALEDSWLVKGSVTGTVLLDCSRCLVSYPEQIATSFEAVFVSRTQEDAFQTDGANLDLAEPLREALLLAIPLAPIHEPDCLGLCAVCGKDLNKEPHDHASADPEKTVD